MMRCNLMCIHSTTIIFLLLCLIIKDANSSQVKFLPGFEGPLPFHLETGYIGVDEGENVQLFYYFVKSSGSADPGNDPVILWLVRGPGCSGLAALLYEIGPMYIDEAEDGGLPILSLNPFAWTDAANMIFLDLPVGTGFSYAKTPEAAHSTGFQSCQQTYEFLRKWLVGHPEFASNPFYIGGSSYTGVTIPVVIKLISDGNEAGITPQINAKGYMIGNPKTFPDEDNFKIPFAHGKGFISDELYESLNQTCGGNYIDIDSKNAACLRDVHTFNQLVDGLDRSCDIITSRDFGKGHRVLYNDDQLYTPKCSGFRKKYVPLWANDPGVQDALHVRKGTIIGTWRRCNKSLPYTNTTWDSIPYHAYLSTKGYRSLIYSGDHDMSVPFLSTQAWIRSLNYSIVDECRQWLVNGQIAGYTRSYANKMTFATIKGGAHIAPESHPLECAAMFKRWIAYQPL